MPGQIERFAARRLSDRTRSILLLFVLCVPLFLSFLAAAVGHQPHLPRTTGRAIRFLLGDALLWATVFILAFRLAGMTAAELRAKTAHPLRTLAFGILWFVVIRILITFILGLALHWIDSETVWATEEKLAAFADVKDLDHHLTLSIVVFAIGSLTAGFAEELWRAGMLAGFQRLFPGLRVSASVVLVSILFALAHLYQGAFGMVNALLLGVMLGTVIVRRRSYWEAAIAHALFDAVSFGLTIVMIFSTHHFASFVILEAERGNIPKLKHWVAVGGDVNATYNPGAEWKNVTMLEQAAEHGDRSEVVRFLLENGANPNLADSRGITPLIATAEQNQLGNAQLLVARGAELNAEDNRGFTALRSAVQYNRLELARFLIESGADVNLIDKEGMTPLAAATKWRYADLQKLLTEKGAK